MARATPLQSQELLQKHGIDFEMTKVFGEKPEFERYNNFLSFFSIYMV